MRGISSILNWLEQLGLTPAEVCFDAVRLHFDLKGGVRYSGAVIDLWPMIRVVGPTPLAFARDELPSGLLFELLRRNARKSRGAWQLVKRDEMYVVTIACDLDGEYCNAELLGWTLAQVIEEQDLVTSFAKKFGLVREG